MAGMVGGEVIMPVTEEELEILKKEWERIKKLRMVHKKKKGDKKWKKKK